MAGINYGKERKLRPDAVFNPTMAADFCGAWENGFFRFRTELARKTGVKITTLANVLNGENYSYITPNYNITKEEFARKYIKG